MALNHFHLLCTDLRKMSYPLHLTCLCTPPVLPSTLSLAPWATHVKSQIHFSMPPCVLENWAISNCYRNITFSLCLIHEYLSLIFHPDRCYRGWTQRTECTKQRNRCHHQPKNESNPLLIGMYSSFQNPMCHFPTP